MEKRKPRQIRTPFMLSLAILVLLSTALSQEMVGGKRVRTGLWKGEQIKYVEGELGFHFRAGMGRGEVQALIQGYGASVILFNDEYHLCAVNLPDTVDILALADRMELDPRIEEAFPSRLLYAQYDPDDYYYNNRNQWALKDYDEPIADIRASSAWDITMGSSSVILAILDSGIPMENYTLSHPDLDDPDKFILGADYAGDGEGVRDLYAHGTHVTGIAAAETDNSEGIAGVCGDCRVLVVQIIDGNGNSSDLKYFQGVMYACNYQESHPGTNVVINASIGSNRSSATPYEEAAAIYSHARDVLIIAASGNYVSPGGPVMYPAALSDEYSNMMAVGATKHDDTRAGYSGNGPELNVMAPGGSRSPSDPWADIKSTTPTYPNTMGLSENYDYLGGTSMATPHVSGLAGLILSVDNALTPLEVRTIIEETADDKGDSGFDTLYGYGRINAYVALAKTNGPPAAPYLRHLCREGQYPFLFWTDGGEPDLDHFVLKRQVSSWPPSYITVYGNSYIDTDFRVDYDGFQISYWVKAVDIVALSSPWSNERSTSGFPTIAKEVAEGIREPSLPLLYALHLAHPNPFNPATTIRYDLPEASSVSLTIYDMLGREVMSWELREPAGYRQVVWDGRDQSGRLAPTGIYIYRLTAASTESDKRFAMNRKMVLMK